MNEVGLRKNKKVSLSGYNSFTRNRKTHENMGGVATSVIEEESLSTIKIMEGENKDEFIVSIHGQFQRPNNVIIIVNKNLEQTKLKWRKSGQG